MPAFTAIGAYVAGTIFGLAGTAALVAGALVATGAAYITSRIINGNANKKNNSAANEGGRIQVAPATNNKIPVIYGNAYVNGIITDARLITLEQKVNDKMFYCIVLGETTNTVGSTYGLESVYWNDLRLTPLDAAGNAHIVKDGRKVVNPTNLPPTSAGSFIVDKTYVITNLGTTTQAQWNTIAGTAGRTYGPGSVFQAATTGASSGTGQALIEDFIDENFIIGTNQYVELRVYAGGSDKTNQIYPAQATTNTANAWNFWGSGGTLYPDGDGSWTSANEMKGLVFAIVSVRYNGEKGFTSLPNVTFQIANSVVNPADVWLDYMTAERYGAGIDVSYIDETARLAWYNFCEEDINYKSANLDPQGGAGTENQATSRYSINGVIDTSNQVKTNIDTILQNGGAWMSYNVDTGLWSPVIKKAVSAGIPGDTPTYFTASRSGSTLTVTTFPSGRIEAGQELYNSTGAYIGLIVSQTAPTAGQTAGQIGTYTTDSSSTITTTTFYTLPASSLEFSDDNIISGITLSSTRLEDLYNSVEVEFYNKYNKDQKAYFRNYLDAGDRNPNEPDNQLRMSLDLCNNSMQADILGQMELRQSRDDLVIEFTASHYGIQAQAGDVIAVSSELYGWAPKYFRVMRVKEIEGDDGDLTAQIQALEYNPDAYTVEPITEFSTAANINIGVYGASPNLPLPPSVVIAAVDADAPIPNFQLQVTIPASGGPFDEIELYYTEGWDQYPITGSIVPGTGSNGAAVGQGLATITATTYGSINAGDRIDLLHPATDIYIVSQITNNPVSKTWVSGGVPGSDPSTSRLITLNNVTGLIVGNTLTGTGIENGSFIIEIDSGTNTVRIEDAVTVQAAGTYYVTGGLGTYIVDTSTTISGTADLYDFPEADNYKLLKKLTPEGNNPTFTNGEIVTDVVTNVPANSATYRRWFVIARMGIKKRFGAFSVPGDVDFEQGRFPYKPNPVASGSLGDLTDVTITSPETEGEFLWYDGTKWINTNEPTVDTNAKTLNLTRRSTTTVQDYETAPAIILTSRVTDAVNDNTDDAGPALRFNRSSGTQSTKTYASGGAVAAFTVTLNNVTGLVVGNKVTGTGLPAGNGALITVIAGNQLTLDTAFTVQAVGTYTIGEPVAFGQVSMEYFGATDVHRFRVTTTTDNFLEDPVDTYPGTSVLISSTKNATDINEGVLYVDAVNDRIGINNTSPGHALHVTGSGKFSGVISTDDTLDATSPVGGSIQTDGGVGIAKKLHVGGTISVDDSLESTSPTSGSIQTDGGIGVVKSGFIGGSLSVTSFIEVNGLTSHFADTTTKTSTAQFTLMTTARNAMKGVVNIKQGSDVHIVEVLVVAVDATTALLTVYGEMFNTAKLADFDADVSSGVLRLRVTPTSATSTVFNYVRDSLA